MAYPARQKKPWRLRCWLTRHGIGGRRMCPRRQARRRPWCWGKFHMSNHRGHRGTQSGISIQIKFLCAPPCSLWLRFFLIIVGVSVISCAKRPDASTLVVLIESSPANLDPRIGKDAQSERIGELIFDSLVHKDDHFNIQPGVAESWETPDAQTYIFHLHHGIRFHDGRPLSARDVKWTLDTMRNVSLSTV